MRTKLDLTTIGYITSFEKITRSRVKDCFKNEKGQLVFVVNKGEISKAIGRGGINIKRASNLLKKNLLIIEFNDSVIQFIHNFIKPLKVTDIQDNEGIIEITAPDTKTRGLLIGRESRNLKFLKGIISKYFDIKDIKIL